MDTIKSFFMLSGEVIFFAFAGKLLLHLLRSRMDFDSAVYDLIDLLSALLVSMGILLYPPLFLVALKKAIRKERDEEQIGNIQFSSVRVLNGIFIPLSTMS